MKSNVCKLAANYIRNGMSRSADFSKAWVTAKIEEIGNRLFMLNMIDRMRHQDRAYHEELPNSSGLLRVACGGADSSVAMS